jgi:hypothetical protein
MTPKEKAKELFEKYFLLHESATDENGVWILSALNKALAKKCALIAVDEILQSDGWSSSRLEWDMYASYWNKVKQEIEKL